MGMKLSVVNSYSYDMHLPLLEIVYKSIFKERTKNNFRFTSYSKQIKYQRLNLAQLAQRHNLLNSGNLWEDSTKP